jgi:thiol-disulfide isomerase/thioredoxin
VFDQIIRKFIGILICVTGSVLCSKADTVLSTPGTNSDSFTDDTRLHGTWRQNRDETVALAFQGNPSWMNKPPEQMDRFKNLFGHTTIIFLNGLETVQVGAVDETFHYRVVDRGTNFVTIRTDDPTEKGRDIRIHFVNGGRGFGIPNPYRYEVRFDKVSAGGTPTPFEPPVYDQSADGSKQISDALMIAKKEGRRVLLQFGANWCGWCLMLHKLFVTNKDIAQELRSNYVVVAIDVNQGHNKEVDAKYGHPTRYGLPVIVILDADGKQLTTENTSELEEGNHHDPDKVMAFLKEWSIK